MKRHFAVVGLAAFVVGACATPPPAPEKAVGTLRILSITPEADSKVTRDTVATVDLEYSIEPFTADRFFIVPVAETGRGDEQRSNAPPEALTILRAPAGRVQLVVPLHYFYWSPQNRKRPLAVWFRLQQLDSKRYSSTIARAGPIIYAME